MLFLDAFDGERSAAADRPRAIPRHELRATRSRSRAGIASHPACRAARRRSRRRLRCESSRAARRCDRLDRVLWSRVSPQMRASTLCTRSPLSDAATPSSGSSSARAPSRNSACARNGQADCTSSSLAPPRAVSPGSSGGIAASTSDSSCGRASNARRAGTRARHEAGDVADAQCRPAVRSAIAAHRRRTAARSGSLRLRCGTTVPACAVHSPPRCRPCCRGSAAAPAIRAAGTDRAMAVRATGRRRARTPRVRRSSCPHRSPGR